MRRVPGLILAAALAAISMSTGAVAAQETAAPSFLAPAVTVIDQDPSRLGRVAAERVFVRQQYPARKLRRRNVLDVALVARDSCGCDVAGRGQVHRQRFTA